VILAATVRSVRLLFVVVLVLKEKEATEMAKRVKPVSSSGTGHTDQSGYTPGPFGPEFGGASGSFDVSPQFNVRPSASRPTPGPVTSRQVVYDAERVILA
jgi:hypothetical protein